MQQGQMLGGQQKPQELQGWSSLLGEAISVWTSSVVLQSREFGPAVKKREEMD
jgi:hypothetical protein